MQFMILTILTLIFVIAAVWFWQSQMRAKETAFAACRRFCEEKNLQLLDETVALKKIAIRREQGSWHVLRRYQFEYCSHGHDRKTGGVVLHGYQVVLTPSIITPSQTIESQVISLAEYKAKNDANRSSH